MAESNYRPGSQHPDEYRQDLNPDALEGENRGAPLPVVDASEIKEIAQEWPELTDADLRQLPVVTAGTRLEQGATYIDLKRRPPREFTAAGSMEADSSHWYVPKAQTHYSVWNRLLGIEQPERVQGSGRARQ